MEEQYLTIAEASEGSFKDRGSTFLSFAYPVENEQQAKDYLKILKRKYHDASHHCYALVLGVKQEVMKASDAGEPKHSAGDPILNQIRAKQLTNILIVVVRYFGGTLLGVPGLIHAYKTAAQEAILHASVIAKKESKLIQIEFNYPEMNEVMYAIKKYSLEIKTQNMTLFCEMTIAVPSSSLS